MKNRLLLPPFSHLYVEEQLFSAPWSDRLERITSRFPKATVVPIGSYQELTQRRTASWNAQKSSPKLVIAQKHGELVYPCSDVAPNFGHPNFYYAVPMQNCLYDCEYCYLQGMYTSPNLVYFINQQDMISETIRLQEKLGQIYLCIAYDNDILAMESLLGVTAEWVTGLRDYPRATVEVRTKSANFHALKELSPAANFILAWTISPADVAERFEAGTPGPESRLKAMTAAREAGWRVRLCLDPLLPVAGWLQSYGKMFEMLDRAGVWEHLEDASYGLFRLPKQILRQARRARPDSALLQSAQTPERRGLLTLSGTDQEQLLQYVRTQLEARIDPTRVWET